MKPEVYLAIAFLSIAVGVAIVLFCFCYPEPTRHITEESTMSLHFECSEKGAKLK